MIRYVFGAGKTGRQVIAALQKIHLKATYVFDNDEKKWGMEVLGVPVIKFNKQYLIKEESLVYVACVNYHDIVDQLKKEDIPEENIIVADSIFADKFLSDIAHHIISEIKTGGLKEVLQCDLLFDLSGGMVLGGVEQWNYELAARLKEKKINACYFVVTSNDNTVENTIYPSINVKQETDIFSLCKTIIEVRPKVIICNFPFSIMKAACIVKRCYNRSLKIIAVVHSDLELYYNTYTFWANEIDKCVGISARIEEKIMTYRQLADKFMRLRWKIKLTTKNNHIYSQNNEPLRIGYAGRIVEYPKRLDRTILIAKDLMKRNVEFRIQIAGDGIYRTELEDIIVKNDLQSYFEFLGRLDHDQMQQFWDAQDIYINCSDYEGHSIAQAEAIASGAVPVMMDVSGAQDDIENGKNGFVVPVGDVKTMAEKIDWLYRNRDFLPVMGAESRRKAEANNRLADRDLEVLESEIICAVK